MIRKIDPHIIDALPEWTVFAFAGFLVATVSAGVFLMVPEPASEPACAPSQAQAYLVAPTPIEPPSAALERPQEDWLWMAPQQAEPSGATDEEAPNRRRHRRRG